MSYQLLFMVFTNYLPGEPECQWVQPRQCRDHHWHMHARTHTYQPVLPLHQQCTLLATTQVPTLCSHPTSSYELAQTAPPFLLNIFTWALDCLNYNSPVKFQLCAAEKVNTDHYFTIQVHFILGTTISDWRQISQPKCNLGMDRGDHSLKQHKGSLRNQNISWGSHFVFVLLGAHVFVLVGYSMWGAKPWLIGQHNF
jgi:hypothetical protein